MLVITKKDLKRYSSLYYRYLCISGKGNEINGRGKREGQELSFLLCMVFTKSIYYLHNI